MGMGEPLDNYTNVTEACRAMIDRNRWNLAHGRVTVSTVGLISQIRRLTKELPEVSLALSLHAPNQEARTAIVPTATRYPIEGLVEALDNHMMAYLDQRRKRNGNNNEQHLGEYTMEERIKESSRRRAMIEYVMLEGETSSLECAHQLGKLCENRHLVVNLIPYNQTDVKDKLRCPSNERMQEFKDIVSSYGTFCTIRRTMGADIASACGQLVQKKGQEARDEKERDVDIEDVVMAPGGVESKQTIPTVFRNTSLQNVTSSDAYVVAPDVPESNAESVTWMDSFSLEDLDRWSNILTLATTVSATCFVASSLLLYVKKR
jgi:sorting nexin-8